MCTISEGIFSRCNPSHDTMNKRSKTALGFDPSTHLKDCWSAETVSVSSPLHTMISAFASSIRMVLLFDCSWFMVDVVTIGVFGLKKYCVVVCGLSDESKFNFTESASMLSIWLLAFVMTLVSLPPTMLTLLTVVDAAVLRLTLLSTTIVEFGWILWWSSCIVFLILANHRYDQNLNHLT